jgi:hypothetical protein
VQPADLMEAFIELANEAGLEVRVAGSRSRGDPELPTASGVCRVRDATWVVLSQSDSVDVQLDVLAGALRSYASELLEERYLPPAVRERLLAADEAK